MGFIQNTFELSLVFGDLQNACCKFLAKSITLLKFAKEAQKYSLAIKSFCYNCLNLRYFVPHKPFLTLMNRPKYLETPENNSKLSLLPTMNLLKVHSTNRPPFHSTHEAETSLPCTAHTGCSGKIVFHGRMYKIILPYYSQLNWCINLYLQNYMKRRIY